MKQNGKRLGKENSKANNEYGDRFSKVPVTYRAQ